MTVFQALVLGIVQGLTEFLPISSSAHLALTPWLFGWPPGTLAFDVSLHIGTLVAVVWYFNQEWRQLVAAAWRIVTQRAVRTEEERRVIYLIIATIPGVIAGLLLEDYAEDTFRNPKLIGVTLIVMGTLLWWIDRVAGQAKGLSAMTWKHAVGVGLAQMCAIIPGVSRSGSTITAGRALGFSRESAAVFSFLMSMPITLGAVILETPKAVAEHGISAPMIVGVIASAVSGWLAISVLLKFVARHSYGVFAAYRWAFGLLIFALIAIRG
jgi:undecaprenyl-diphosphatase